MEKVRQRIKIGEEFMVPALQDAAEKLDSAEGELIVDFSSVKRVTSAGLAALRALADSAEKKGVKVVLQDVNVEIYKALKLVKLTSRFSFCTPELFPATESRP